MTQPGTTMGPFHPHHFDAGHEFSKEHHEGSISVTVVQRGGCQPILCGQVDQRTPQKVGGTALQAAGREDGTPSEAHCKHSSTRLLAYST